MFVARCARLESNLRCPFRLKTASIHLQLNFGTSMSKKRKLDDVLPLSMPSARSQIDLTAARQELIAVCRSSKSSLSRTLHALRRMDLLRPDVDIGESEKLEREALGRANQLHTAYHYLPSPPLAMHMRLVALVGSAAFLQTKMNFMPMSSSTRTSTNLVMIGTHRRRALRSSMWR